MLNTIKYDFLPSMNLVYSINEKQNLRLGPILKHVNRPEFRELAPFRVLRFYKQIYLFR
jgi:hypothetical protein